MSLGRSRMLPFPKLMPTSKSLCKMKEREVGSRVGRDSKGSTIGSRDGDEIQVAIFSLLFVLSLVFRVTIAFSATRGSNSLYT